MSSILKALRKLEEEKAALGESRVDLARDILKRTAPRRTDSSGMLLKLVFLVVLLGALVLCAWLLLRPEPPVAVVETVAPPVTERQPVIQKPAEPVTAPRQPPPVPVRSAPLIQPAVEPPAPKPIVEVKPEPAPVVTEPLPQATQQPLATPQTDAAVETPVSPPPAAVAVDAADSAEPVVPEPVRTAPAVTAAPPEVSPDRVEKIPATFEFREEVLPKQQPLAVAVEPVVEPAPVPAIERMPELTVNAIAFKPLPGERLAVINDLPVMEGTSIDGVQIIEILPDGVRLSWQGTELILPLAD